MNRTQSARRMRERRLSRALMIAFAVVLFTGVFLQIALMARLSAQNKQVAEVQNDTHLLVTRAENLNLALNQYHNLERIAYRAKQLGMEQPDETQLRVVNLPTLIDGTSTQSADNSGAEEMMD